MHVIVGGCGRVGSEIADHLSDDPDNDVVAIDVDPLAFDRLGSGFNGETVVGDVTDRDVLERAGVDRAEGLIAVTRFDNANLMAVEIGTVLYGVPRAVARLFNPEREQVYRKLGVRYVSGTGIIAKLFLNELRGHAFPHHVHFAHGDVDLVDVVIGQGGNGRSVAELEVEGRFRVAAIQRGMRVFIPESDDLLRTGDVVSAAARLGVERTVEAFLQDRSTESVL